MIAWALTYVVHSTALILLAGAAARTPWGRAPRIREAIWKGALFGALMTATLQQVAAGSASFAPPIRLSASHAAGLQPPVAGGWPWGVVVWSAIGGLAAARLLGGWLRLRRVTGRRRVLRHGSLRRQLDAILADAGATRRVTLTCSRGLAVPRAIGRREICVPMRALRDLTPAEQRALLAHETAHLLRHDGAWLAGAALVQIVVWWQPLTRLAVARLGQAMELCCDDWAAARLPNRMALARCLLKVGEWGVAEPARFPLAAFTSRGSRLRERVERLIDPDPLTRSSAATPWIAAVPLIAVVALAPRVMLAEAGMMPAVVVPGLLRADAAVATASGLQPAPATSARAAGAAKHRRSPSSASTASPSRALPSSSGEPAPAVGEAARSQPPADSTTIITMTDPLVTPSSRLRLTGGAVRGVALDPPPPKPELLVAEDRLERRIGAWLDWHRRNPAIDPLRPKYPRPEGRSYPTDVR